jgi:hypothetical protein
MQPCGRIPLPGVMTIDRKTWRSELHLSNFVNAYYQFRDLSRLVEVRTVLVVGPGQGLGVHVLKWRGFEVSTFDIDEVFKPDYLGSVHDMHLFRSRQFDAVIASHVLEHLAAPYLDSSLAEIARVGRYALIYLPVAGRHIQLRLTPGLKEVDLSFILDVFNRFHRPDGVTPRYSSGQHFWEVGLRGFRPRDLRQRMSRFFKILHVYRNRDWTPSMNFVLESKIN